MVPLAAKITGAPAQALSRAVVIPIVGTIVGLTVMVRPVEVAVAGEAQASDDVSTQVTEAPVVSEDVIKLLLLVPALLPFTFH